MITCAPLASAQTPAPIAAAAYSVGPVSVVTWTPSPATVDGYHVYGIVVSGAVLLTTVVDTTAVVPSGYESYAVTAYAGADESSPTFTTPLPCASINPWAVPPISINADCPLSKERVVVVLDPL